MSRKTLKKCLASKSKKKTRRHNRKIITHELKSLSEKDIEKDFKNLTSIGCRLKVGARSRVGNKVVDAFTLEERLHTKGDQGVSFYDFWECRDHFAKKDYVRKMLDFYKDRKTSVIRKHRYIFNLYFSNIAIFSPLRAMDIYCKVKAKRVLDFTMGWGGRLVGACALELDAYYGVDINKHLKKPYSKLTRFLESNEDHKTKIQLRFEDALKTNYSKMDYDCVLTSPPYYDIEVYRGKQPQYKSKEEWNNKFYKPLFEKTYKHMKKGGHYCLNVNEEIYENACVPVLGKATQKHKLKKETRIKKSKKSKNKKSKNKKSKQLKESNYQEYVYIWVK